MSEVTKLYDKAGIAKTGIRKCTTCEYLDCENYCFISENNKCDKFSYQYPPFTAEKVIYLLEWEANRGIIDIKHSQKGYQLFTYIHTGNYGKSIIDAVASYFCVKWQDLTEEEHRQIKEILR